MEPPYPSPTSKWHNDTYASISPSRPELSLRSKSVIITGAGSGIGREAALAFASAGADRLFLIGRRQDALERTRDLVASKSVDCSIHAVSVVDEHAIKNIAATVGTWDVLILNAAFLSSPAPVAEASVEDWWQGFETNVKGAMTTIKALLPAARVPDAAILGVSTGLVGMPPQMLPGMSAYVGSKFAQVKLLEFVAAENPGIYVASVHPGVVETAMFRKSGYQADACPMDTVQLPAHFLVWMASHEAKFLRGRTVWSNWDVEELKGRAQEIRKGPLMTAGIYGWPYTPA